MANNFFSPVKENFNALTDVINRGTIAGTIGAPVDLANTVLNTIGLGSKNPIMGSEWIGQKMEDTGIVSSKRRPLAELAAGLAIPASTAIKTMLFAAKDAKAAKIASTAAKSIEEKLAGVKKAQENNTYQYSKDYSKYGYGRRMGYPQPAGTSVEKLTSNFANTREMENPNRQAIFREQMLDRALKPLRVLKGDTIETSVLPFRNDMELVIEATNKNTRLQVIKNDVPIAAARLENGMLDSIGVHETEKGNKIGSDLLQFIHDSKIGNIFEVPDRSPGFVKIQKEIIAKINKK